MSRRAPSFLALSLAAIATTAGVVACGDSTSGEGGAAATATGTTGTAGTKASSTATGIAGSCTQPGDKGNDKGVGEFCTPGGDECDPFKSTAPLCLADLQQPEWMCTRIGCDSPDDCGQDAGCHKDPAGSACVPCRCDPTAEGCPGAMTTSSSASTGSGSASTGSASTGSSSGTGM